MKELTKHLGPGDHPSGSPQSVHGGGGEFRSASELREAGYIPIFRGTGKEGLKEIRPSTEGVYGPGVYFYDDAKNARIYAEREGGVITAFVYKDDARIEDDIIIVSDESKIIRRGNIPTEQTRASIYSQEWADTIERALNATEPAPVAKYDPDQPRDKEGRWVITSEGMSLYHVTPRENLPNIKSLGLLRSSKAEAYSMGEGNTQIDGVFLGNFEQAQTIAAEIKDMGGDPVILDVYIPAKSKIYEDVTMPEFAILYPGDIPSRRIREYSGTFIHHKNTNFSPWFQTGKMPKRNTVTKYDPDQPRAVAGTSTGGQWISQAPGQTLSSKRSRRRARRERIAAVKQKDLFAPRAEPTPARDLNAEAKQDERDRWAAEVAHADVGAAYRRGEITLYEAMGQGYFPTPDDNIARNNRQQLSAREDRLASRHRQVANAIMNPSQGPPLDPDLQGRLRDGYLTLEEAVAVQYERVSPIGEVILMDEHELSRPLYGGPFGTPEHTTDATDLGAITLMQERGLINEDEATRLRTARRDLLGPQDDLEDWDRTILEDYRARTQRVAAETERFMNGEVVWSRPAPSPELRASMAQFYEHHEEAYTDPDEYSPIYAMEHAGLITGDEAERLIVERDTWTPPEDSSNPMSMDEWDAERLAEMRGPRRPAGQVSGVQAGPAPASTSGEWDVVKEEYTGAKPSKYALQGPKPTVEQSPLQKEDNLRMQRDLFGRELTDDELSALAGAQPDCKVRVSSYENLLRLDVTGPFIEQQGRNVFRNSAGELEIYNAIFMIDKYNPVPDGYGASSLYTEANMARKLGVSKISVTGGQSGSYNPAKKTWQYNIDTSSPRQGMIGFWVWPRIGYNAPTSRIAPGVKMNLMAALHNDLPDDFHGLMSTQAGRDAWMQYGEEMHFELDLAPGSVDYKWLQEYLKQKDLLAKLDVRKWQPNIKREEMDSDIWTPADDAAMDRALAVIEAERVKKYDNDLTQRERLAGWLTKIAPTLPPSQLTERLEKALGYTPELYRIYIEHGVGRFMAGQINADYFKMITRGTIEHGLDGAWVDGMEQNGLAYPDDMTPQWRMELDAMIDKEESFLDGFIHAMQLGKERVEAGGSYNKELEQAMTRGELWARRYADIKQRALRITAASPKAKKLASRRKAIRMVWRLGLTEEHCATCLALNGVVAFEWEWERAGYFPRIPNEKLECKGFRCDCTCEPTDLRRSKALRNGRVLESWIPERIQRIKTLGVAGARLGTGITKYDPDQARAPEGSSEGGQWTKEGAGGSIAKQWESIGYKEAEAAEYIPGGALFGTAQYWITPDNSVILVDDHGGAAQKFLKANPGEIPGADWRDGQSMATTWLTEKGDYIRIGIDKEFCYIEAPVTKQILRRIQKLIETDKFKPAPRIEWSGRDEEAHPRMVPTTYGELLMANHINLGALKAEQAQDLAKLEPAPNA